MTIKNDNYNSYSLDFFGKECKNNYHNQCSGQWQGLGFQVTCNCECHTKKTVIRKRCQIRRQLPSKICCYAI